MTFEQEMKKYKSLSPGDRLKKVINLLSSIKDRNENLKKTYNMLTTSKNLTLNMIDDIHKVLLETMIYQQWIDQKASNDKINAINNSLHLHLEKEKLEREREEKEYEKLLNFS